MRLFLDTNIVIDLIGNREPFSSEAAALFQLASDGEVQLLVSDLSIINIVYILRRLKYALADIYAALNGIRPLITITGIGSDAIDECLRAHWEDFEDHPWPLYGTKLCSNPISMRRQTTPAPSFVKGGEGDKYASQNSFEKKRGRSEMDAPPNYVENARERQSPPAYTLLIYKA